MNKNRTRKILLAVLVITFGYIWWGNIQLFVSSEPMNLAKQSKNRTHAMSESSGSKILYRTPRTNPFIRFSKTVDNKPPITKKKQVAVVPTQLPANFILTGFVRQGLQSQIVIRESDQSVRLLTTGDTLHSWKLIEIKDEGAIFKLGKHYDTLHLGNHSTP